MMVRLSQLAHMLNINWQGSDPIVNGFSTDSRNINANDVFIALSGERFDGHDYLTQAEAAGAAAAIVSRDIAATLPTLPVKDTHQALMQLAAQWRQQFELPIACITGSCGKTSTRALLQKIFSGVGPTLASEKSFNNNIGVPLTLLRLRKEHRYAVLEVGANHPGEIAELIKIIKPKVATITNAGPAHLAGFGSIEGVARAKGEIFSGLPQNGIAVINQDDAFADVWRDLKGGRQHLTFGIQESADLMASNIHLNREFKPSFVLQTPEGHCIVQLQLLGRHSVYNALAAATCALAVGVSLDHIKQGLETGEAEVRRLNEKKGYANATIIDDSYNANPTSVAAAIDVLSHRDGTLVLVLGDMLELGSGSGEWHEKIGQQAHQAGIQHLFCVGTYSAEAAKAFGASAHHFQTKEELVQELRSILNDRVTVLVKGSNSMGMNKVVEALLQE